MKKTLSYAKSFQEGLPIQKLGLILSCNKIFMKDLKLYFYFQNSRRYYQVFLSTFQRIIFASSLEKYYYIKKYLFEPHQSWISLIFVSASVV